MKKTLKIVGIVAAVAAILFASCKNEVQSNIITVENPAFSVKAYPGYNKIVWSPVVNGYVNAIFRDDGQKIPTDFGSYSYEDFDVADGEEYTYTIYTVPNSSYSIYGGSNQNNTIVLSSEYEKVGNKASVTVKAIKPDFFQKDKNLTALDLVYYEDGSYNEKADTSFVVTEDNIDVAYDDGAVIVQVPQKEYLDYEVKVYLGNLIEFLPTYKIDWDPNFNSDKFNGEERSAFKSVNKKVTYYAKTDWKAGTYSVVVNVKAKAKEDFYFYVSSKEIKAKNTVTINQLGESEQTEIKYADYLEANKIRVAWKPSKKFDGTNWAADKYSVYVTNSSSNKLNYEKVSDTIKSVTTAAGSDGSSADIYYVDYDVNNNDIEYKFAVVLSDSNNYGETKVEKVSAYNDEKVQYSNANISIEKTDETEKDYTAKFTFTLGKSQVLSSVEYAFVDSVDLSGDKVLYIDYTKVDIEEKTFVTIKKVPSNRKLVCRYIVTEAGKEKYVGINVSD